MDKKEFGKFFGYGLGLSILILIFNNIASIYEVSTLHRVIMIFAISLTHVFLQPMFFLFQKEFKNKKK